MDLIPEAGGEEHIPVAGQDESEIEGNLCRPHPAEDPKEDKVQNEESPLRIDAMRGRDGSKLERTWKPVNVYKKSRFKCVWQTCRRVLHVLQALTRPLRHITRADEKKTQIRTMNKEVDKYILAHAYPPCWQVGIGNNME